VRLFVKLAEAVQHAHERGVIHRDLKPGNVLVAESGQPKVLDFGIARAIGADVPRLTIQTAHGQLMGTLAYMSPEQLRGRSSEVDTRSDVYALGVLLYRLLAERLPFDVSGLPWAEAIQHVLEDDVTPIGSVNDTLAGPIEQVVARAMSRDVAGRYQTAADLAADLERFLDGRRPIAASVTGLTAVRGGPPSRDEPLPPPIVFAPDVDTICAATRSDEVTARSASTGKELWCVKVGGVRALAASTPGRFIAAGLASGAISLIDVKTGALCATLDAHQAPVAALAFSYGCIVAAWDDGRVETLTIPLAV